MAIVFAVYRGPSRLFAYRIAWLGPLRHLEELDPYMVKASSDVMNAHSAAESELRASVLGHAERIR